MKNTDKIIETLSRYGMKYKVNDTKHYTDIIITSSENKFKEITLTYEDDILISIKDEFDIELNTNYIIRRDVKLLIDKVHQVGVECLSRQYREKWYYISTILKIQWIEREL